MTSEVAGHLSHWRRLSEGEGLHTAVGQSTHQAVARQHLFDALDNIARILGVVECVHLYRNHHLGPVMQFEIACV